nr:hypothetical protein [Armatimonas sp.]
MNTILRTTFAAAALLSTTAFSHAAGPFVANSHWSGFQISGASGVSSARLDVGNDPKMGTLAIAGQMVPVSISCTTTGEVNLQGLGIPYAGVRVVGMIAAQGGTFSLAANYVVRKVDTLRTGTGRLSLLRSYGRDSDRFLTNPWSGNFTSTYGTTGRMAIERSQTSDFGGKMTFGEFQYAVIGTINPLPNPNGDGTHEMAMIGENLDPRSITPCFVTPCFHPGEVAPCFKPGDIAPCFEPSSLVSCFNAYGLLVPAARTGGAVRLMGIYALSGTRGTVDTGKFQLGQ